MLYFKSLVFAGDSKQRSPFCSQNYEPKSVLDFVEEEEDKQDEPFIKRSFLDIQFRMQPDLGTVISDNFYDGKVRNFKKSTGRKTCYFYDFKSSLIEDRGNARNAPEEMREAHRMAAAFTRAFPSYEIAVLTAYNAQYYFFEKLCTKRPLGVNVGCHTIDSFMGKEADVVIVCICAYEKKVRKFMRKRKRTNVALSRAKERLIVMGCLRTMETNDMWREILNSFDIVSSKTKQKVL